MNNSHQPNASISIPLTEAARGTALVVVESCIAVLLNIASLVGNSLVCLAFYRNPSLRTVTNYFVLSLALTDLSMAVLAMPLITASTMTIRTIVTEELSCKLYYHCVTVLARVSLLTVMLLAINRYFCVVRPALYANIFSKKRCVSMAVCAWIVTIAVVIVLIVAMRNQAQIVTVEYVSCVQFLSNYCLTKLDNAITIIYIAVPGLVIVVCYIKIYQTIRHHNTAAAPSSQGEHSAYGVEEAKMTRMLTVVVVGFYLCWLPLFVSRILLALAVLGKIANKYHNFYVTFPLFASSVINPIVYGTMSQSFRNEFLKIVRRQP